jgi:hypothetical protein
MHICMCAQAEVLKSFGIVYTGPYYIYIFHFWTFFALCTVRKWVDPVSHIHNIVFEHPVALVKHLIYVHNTVL